MTKPNLKAEHFIGLVYSLTIIEPNGQYSIFDFGKKAVGGFNVFEPSDPYDLN